MGRNIMPPKNAKMLKPMPVGVNSLRQATHVADKSGNPKSLIELSLPGHRVNRAKEG